METFMGAAMVIEVGLLSSLLAVCMTWLVLRGLFELMPAAPRRAQPVQFRPGPQNWIRTRREA